MKWMYHFIETGTGTHKRLRMNRNLNRKPDHRSRQTMTERRARYQNSPLCDEHLTAAKIQQNMCFIANTGVNA